MDSRGMSGLPPIATELRTSLEVRFVPILLQKSNIERPRKSRESGFLDAAAAARFSGANTKAGGPFCMKRCGPSRRRGGRASRVFNIFVLHPKKTFSTKSALSRHRCFDQRPLCATSGHSIPAHYANAPKSDRIVG